MVEWLMEIRRLGPGAEELLRELRLRSLTDAPDAFASNAASERDFPSEHWAGLLASESDAILLAEDDDRPVGLTGVAVDWDDKTFMHIWGMWVESTRRGSGIGAALLDAAIDWARRSGAKGVRLWVAETNPSAANLYASRGFTLTGVTKPHPPNPEVIEVAMELRF